MRRWVAAGAAGVLLLTGCGHHSSAEVRFRIAAQSALFDAPLGVRITGVAARQRVTVAAAVADKAGLVWRSSASYLPDSSGTVDLATEAPVAGDYTGAH